LYAHPPVWRDLAVLEDVEGIGQIIHRQAVLVNCAGKVLHATVVGRNLVSVLKDPSRARRIEKVVNAASVLYDGEHDIVAAREQSMTFGDSYGSVLGTRSACG